MSHEEPDDGGPAFPAMLPGGNYCTPGMTLRDYFAAQALTGLISQCDMPNEVYAKMSYSIADAMLAARESSTTAQGIGGGK